MTEHRPVNTFLMPIPEHVTPWIGSIETHKIERRFLLFPFLSVLAVVICALIFLSVILWHVPGTTDAFARLSATELIHRYFPTAKSANSYLAQRYGQPWDVFLPAILAINMASCLVATVFFSVWIAGYPLAISNDADRKNSQWIARSRGAATRAMFGLLVGIVIIVFMVALGLFAVDPSPDVRSNIALYTVFQHLLIMFLPTAFVTIAFLLKFRRMLKRLR
jgi:hypothetical protein